MVAPRKKSGRSVRPAGRRPGGGVWVAAGVTMPVTALREAIVWVLMERFGKPDWEDETFLSSTAAEYLATSVIDRIEEQASRALPRTS
jgi:hypothetical protein